MRIAITRQVSDSIAQCELTHLAREPIDLELARQQHEAYEHQLAALGCEVRRLPEAHDLPDAVFVEDIAVVVDELAILARSGAASRRPETATLEPVLGGLRPLARIAAPGTLDGGDVLQLGRTLHVGLSCRTNAAGVEQLSRLVAPHGYTVRPIPIDKCLHLKSAATEVGDDLVLIQPRWVDPRSFHGLGLIEVDVDEPLAANALRIGECVLLPSTSPRTRERLEARGIAVRSVDLSELAKAEGSVTCCSLILKL